MENFTVKIDELPGFNFTGELLANVNSRLIENSSIWKELSLYRTESGKLVCQQINHGKEKVFRGEICSTMNDVMDFFGHRWLTKMLYNKAGIDDSLRVIELITAGDFKN